MVAKLESHALPKKHSQSGIEWDGDGNNQLQIDNNKWTTSRGSRGVADPRTATCSRRLGSYLESLASCLDELISKIEEKDHSAKAQALTKAFRDSASSYRKLAEAIDYADEIVVEPST